MKEMRNLDAEKYYLKSVNIFTSNKDYIHFYVGQDSQGFSFGKKSVK